MIPTKTKFNDDQEALKASADLQSSTKQAISRIQNNLTKTVDVGATTLEELYEQRRKLERIDQDGDRLHDNLDETEYQVSKLGSWFGGKRKKKHKKNGLAVAEEENNPQQSSTKSQSSKWGFRKSSKKEASASTSELSFTPQLFDKEQALYQGEHKEQLQDLADGDREIDAQINQIGNQLGSLLKMAEEIGGETKQQGRQLGGLNESLAEARQRQNKANKKIRKYL